MAKKNDQHQSLALLAGVAVDKGPEETQGETSSHSIQLFHPAGSYSLSPSAAEPLMSQGNLSITGERENVIHISNRTLPDGTVRLPIKLQVTHAKGIDECLGENMVEVQYIIDPGGQFQITSDDSSDTSNINRNEVILGTIGTNSASGNVLHLRQPQSPGLQVLSGDFSQQPQGIEEVIVKDGNMIVAQDKTVITNDGHAAPCQDKCVVASRPFSQISFPQTPTILCSNPLKSCFLCHDSTVSWKDIFDPLSQCIMLPQLLSRYMNISIVQNPSNSNDYPLCEKCEQMLLRWHEVVSRYRQENDTERKLFPALEMSEDDNSLGGQSVPRTDNHDVPVNSEDSGNKSPKKQGTRKGRYSTLQNQIKAEIFASSFHYLIKRDLTDDDWEYIAERLHTTKSNSSIKMKEIETLVFQHENLVSIFCDDCRKSISGGKEAYYEHRKTVHANAPIDYTLPCDMCGNFYPEKDSTGLSRNYFSHWIKHFYFEECQDCKEQFPNPSLLKKHMVAHQQRPGFPCPKCNKVLVKKTSLKQHIKTHLPEEEKKKHALTCHICGKMITAPSLKAHIFSVHSDLRPWRCEVCGANFKHKSDLSGHRNAVHLKIKKFNCNVCSKSFSHNCGLRVHMMKHENRREHECTVCGKRFITQWHLKKHSFTHKEERDIICGTCGKGFKKLESLQEHVTLHTGELPYECHICKRKVRVLSNLYKHFMVHKKNKTYYSKKDGLPDPLDAYILEQQKRKQANSIVDEVIKSGQNTVASTSAASKLEASTSDSTSAQPEVLQVNRSVTRITYSASTSNAQLPYTTKKNVILAGTTPVVTSSISNEVGVVIPSGGKPFRLPLVQGSNLLECNTPLAVIHSADTLITNPTSRYLTYRIVDENGVEMDTVRIPSTAKNEQPRIN